MSRYFDNQNILRRMNQSRIPTYDIEKKKDVGI